LIDNILTIFLIKSGQSFYVSMRRSRLCVFVRTYVSNNTKLGHTTKLIVFSIFCCSKYVDEKNPLDGIAPILEDAI